MPERSAASARRTECVPGPVPDADDSGPAGKVGLTTAKRNRAELQSLPGEYLFQAQEILYSIQKVNRRQTFFVEQCDHPRNKIAVCRHIPDYFHRPSVQRAVHCYLVAIISAGLRGAVLPLEREICIVHCTTPLFSLSVRCSHVQEARGTVPAGLFFCALKSCSDLALKVASLFPVGLSRSCGTDGVSMQTARAGPAGRQSSDLQPRKRDLYLYV